MTEEAYWEIWDNVTEVRFGSDVDVMDEPDIADDEHETLELYIERRILEEDKRDFCIAFHPNHVNKDDCTEPFTKP